MSAALVAGLTGAAAVLVVNGLLVQHTHSRGGANGLASPSTVTADTRQSPAAYVTGPGESNRTAPAIAVGGGVESMIYGLLPGMVAVDVAGSGHDQQGTGLVLRSDGMILTTSALVAGATSITVTASDGQEWNANLVGTDPTTGTAVISVPSSGLAVLPVQSENEVQAGQVSVVVCANSRPGGAFQAALGRFSGVHQQVDVDGGATLMDAIVIDSTPPNPMGGIIFDDQGRVVGILQSVLRGGESTQGVATPISAIHEAADSLMAGQEVVHAWLGIAGGAGAGGAIVAQVAPASPAAAAGIHPGDVVTSLDAHPIASMQALEDDIGSLQPGSTVLLHLDRNGSIHEVAATLDGQPGSGP